MKKIIILARVSTSPQDIESQTSDLKREANRLGYDDKHQIIIETVESAIKLDEEQRLGLNKMKHYIETDKNVDCVICWEPSRLARRQKILYSITEYLFNHKIQLYILNPRIKFLTDDRTQIDTNANIVFSLFATLAENEMMIKKERFQREKNKMRQAGQKFACSVIFGYMKDKDKKCIPHPVNSLIIVDIYNHYINTDSSLYETYQYVLGKYPELFKVLEYKKAQHKIRHFFETEIYYTGNWCYPPLITKEMWDNVHDKMSKAVCRARYNSKRELLCRGKIYCGQCGRMMTGSGGNTKAYVCSTNKLHSCQVNFEAADWIMWEEVRTVVNINSSFEQDQKKEEMKLLLSNKQNLKQQYSFKRQEMNQKMTKLLDLYINGIIEKTSFENKNNELKKELEIYVEKINKLDTEINSLSNIIEETQKDFMNVRSISADNINDFETRQEMVRKYISKMIVTKIPNERRKFLFEFEYTHPLISCKSKYRYEVKNQKHNNIYRINEDGTEDLIF
jgi:DNA invertase Pin-like site-specific DNA recombinase